MTHNSTLVSLLTPENGMYLVLIVVVGFLAIKIFSSSHSHSNLSHSVVVGGSQDCSVHKTIIGEPSSSKLFTTPSLERITRDVLSKKNI
jgi:hypothetical protein